MKYFVIPALALSLAVGVPAKAKDVRIVEQRIVHPADCDDQDDLLMPVCTSVMTVFENLRYKPVEATVNCGNDLDEEMIVLPPRTRLTVTIAMTIYVPNPGCTLKSVKEKQ